MNTERPIDIFAKRLDEIFEMGDPTKSLIYDAFHKATERKQGNYMVMSPLGEDWEQLSVEFVSHSDAEYFLKNSVNYEKYPHARIFQEIIDTPISPSPQKLGTNIPDPSHIYLSPSGTSVSVFIDNEWKLFHSASPMTRDVDALALLRKIGYDNGSITPTEKWIAEEIYKLALTGISLPVAVREVTDEEIKRIVEKYQHTDCTCISCGIWRKNMSVMVRDLLTNKEAK